MLKDLAKKNKDELMKLRDDMVVSLRNFRFSLAGSKTKNLKEGRNLRRDIARVKTALQKTNGK